MKDALFIVLHDIYIGSALYELRLGALRYEEKISVEAQTIRHVLQPKSGI